MNKQELKKYYQKLGRKGGLATYTKHGSKIFKEMQKKSVLSRKSK